MSTTTIRSSEDLVKGLVAAMHMDGMFTRPKATEFRLLLVKTHLHVVDALEELLETEDFPGSIEVRPGKTLGTWHLFKIMLNISAAQVGGYFSYFAQQLGKLNNDLDGLFKFQVGQKSKVEKSAQILHLLMAIDRKYLSRRKRLINSQHKESIVRSGTSICHRVPQFAESLGIRENDLVVWASQ